MGAVGSVGGGIGGPSGVAWPLRYLPLLLLPPTKSRGTEEGDDRWGPLVGGRGRGVRGDAACWAWLAWAADASWAEACVCVLQLGRERGQGERAGQLELGCGCLSPFPFLSLFCFFLFSFLSCI